MVMQHKEDNTANREMNNNSTALHEIHFPGIHEGCKNKENKLHPTEQQTGQNILHGYSRSRIPDYGPVKGEAG